jgi:hypothetical protein
MTLYYRDFVRETAPVVPVEPDAGYFIAQMTRALDAKYNTVVWEFGGEGLTEAEIAAENEMWEASGLYDKDQWVYFGYQSCQMVFQNASNLDQLGQLTGTVVNDWYNSKFQ